MEVGGDNIGKGEAAGDEVLWGGAESFSVENGYFNVLWRDFSGDVRDGLDISAWWGRAVDGDGAGFGHGKDYQWT